MNFDKYVPMARTGAEPFHQDGKEVGFDLLSFWRWSGSEILGNALRGVLAEYIVAKDVGCLSKMRTEWDAYDLLTPDGIQVEVKSGAYLQCWEQKSYSKIVFSVPQTRGWDAKTNEYSLELKRHADVYVFCVLAHKDKKTIDPLNLAQWNFYVLPANVLDQHIGAQKTLALSSLLTLDPIKCTYGRIRAAIQESLEIHPITDAKHFFQD